MEKRKFYKYFWGNIFFLLFFATHSFSQPSAHVEINGIDYMCFDRESISLTDSIRIHYKITFTGQHPFGARLVVHDEEGKSIPPPYVTPRSATPIIQGYWHSNLGLIVKDYEGVSQIKFTLTILDYYDGNVPEDQWITDNISGEIIYNLYQLPSPRFDRVYDKECGETTTIIVIDQDGDGNAVGGTFKWEEENGKGSFEPDNELITTFSANPSDDPYKIKFTQTNGECPTQISTDLIFLGAPKGTISTDSEICGEGDAKIIFNFENSIESLLPFTVEYTDNEGATYPYKTMTTLVSDTTINVKGTKTFTLKSATDLNDCESTPSDLTGNALVKDITPQPFAFAPENEACGNSIELWTLKPKENENETGEWTFFEKYITVFGTEAWVPAEGECKYDKDDQYSLHEIYSFETPEILRDFMDFRLFWTLSVPFNNDKCSATDTVYVKLWEIPTANAGKDTIAVFKEITLNAKEPEIGTGIWSIISGNCDVIEPNNRNSKVIINDFFQPIELQWTVTHGSECKDSSQIKITKVDFKAPNAFSPGDNGKNDFFVIYGAWGVEDNKLVVFDKNGIVVYEKEGYGTDNNYWNGTYKNGDPVPDGIYNYVFIGKDIKPIKNFLVIKRDK
ncbi:MAG: gliding motility-associated C-terminal domain-containing protein [Marinilabiliaceae bacterium]|nr:gliding motility-associated C-terminal domain-containing protein [Marinilabiliaceae bacterium]